MAKKQSKGSKPKTLRKTTTMVNTLNEGKKFLVDTKKKRVTRTRTMAQTIKEGNEMLQKRPTRNNKKDDQVSQSVENSGQKKKQKKIVKSRLAGSKNKNGSKKSIKASKPQKKKCTPAEPAAFHPMPPINNIKKTIFKTKSKDHLPIPAFGFIDVCFCIDATGSMGSQLAQAQSTIISIIHNIEHKVQTEGLTLRFAVVSYRDHPPQDSTYVTQALDFTDGHQASEYVQKLQAGGGGDFAQAVHDGLMHCCTKLNWVQLPGTPMLRYIFHIADAPPHGKEFGNMAQQQQGCRCGIKTQQVFHEINLRQIHYRLIMARTGPQLTQMQNQFKKGIVDFQSTALSHAKEMDVKVSDMIIHEVISG